VCTSLLTDTSNCGDCGRACASAEVDELVCSGGLCTSSCTSGWGNCTEPAAPDADDGCETDLGGDLSHCGACERACASAEVDELACSEGLCTSSCTSGWGNCEQPAAPDADDGCETDLSASVDHCGDCGNSCTVDAVDQADCVDGACVIVQCELGYGDCDDEPSTGCETDLDSDLDHCGECSIACPAPQSCVSGVCTCPNETDQFCDDDCYDLSVTNEHCGDCSIACSANQTCVDGVCIDEPCYPATDVTDRIDNVPASGGCWRTTEDFTNLGCWGFGDATVLINDVEVTCDESGPAVSLPPKYNGYYYFEVSAGATGSGSSMDWW
jgi:hypothetical protein